MASPRPKAIKKFPKYVMVSGHDVRECKLADAKYAQELDQLFIIDQMTQRYDVLRYAEQELTKKNLRSFTQDEIYQFIIKLHRISAHSLVLLNNQVNGGTFANSRVAMRRETGIPGKEFDRIFIFSQHNYEILKQKHGINVAESYKNFCNAFAEAIKKDKNQHKPSNLIFENGLDKHFGFEAYSLVYRFGEKPENIAKAMVEFCHMLSAKLQSESANPLDCAAYALFRLCQIHPFPNGNGTVARILMNCVLMDFGINPIGIAPDNRPDYYHSIENATLEDLDLLKRFINKNLNKPYSKKDAEPIFSDGRALPCMGSWGPNGSDQCVTYSDHYDVISAGNVQQYLNYSGVMFEDKVPPFLKMEVSGLKDKLIKFKIDEIYCERKGTLNESAGNLHAAIYYYQRAADFCLEAKKMEQAERLSKLSEKLRKPIQANSLMEKKVSAEISYPFYLKRKLEEPTALISTLNRAIPLRFFGYRDNDCNVDAVVELKSVEDLKQALSINITLKSGSFHFVDSKIFFILRNINRKEDIVDNLTLPQRISTRLTSAGA